MKALILQKDAAAACATSRVLIDKGFQILCVETLAVAHALINIVFYALLCLMPTQSTLKMPTKCLLKRTGGSKDA